MDVDWARTLAVWGVVVLAVLAVLIGYRRPSSLTWYREVMYVPET